MARPPIPPPPIKPSEKKTTLPEKDEFIDAPVPFMARPPQQSPRSPPAHSPQAASIMGMPTTSRGPPLFIKIEKYREVVNNLHKLKTYSLSLRDALDALAEIEKELQQGISLTHMALEKFNETIAVIDAKMTRMTPDDTEDHPRDVEELDKYAHELQDQMEKIRRELKNISF